MGMLRCQKMQIRNLSLRIRQASRSTCRSAILLRPPRLPPLDLRWRFFQDPASGAVGGFALRRGPEHAPTGPYIPILQPNGKVTLPLGICPTQPATRNSLTAHILKAGYEVPTPPAVLLLHGFPEL